MKGFFEYWSRSASALLFAGAVGSACDNDDPNFDATSGAGGTSAGRGGSSTAGSTSGGRAGTASGGQAGRGGAATSGSSGSSSGGTAGTGGTQAGAGSGGKAQGGSSSAGRGAGGGDQGGAGASDGGTGQGGATGGDGAGGNGAGAGAAGSPGDDRCPEDEPSDGMSCPDEGGRLSCEYEETLCYCRGAFGSEWDCEGCPPGGPNEGEDCTGYEGAVCISCECEVDGAEAAWFCGGGTG